MKIKKQLKEIKNEFESKIKILKEGESFNKKLNEKYSLNLSMPEKNLITISLWEWCQQDQNYTNDSFIKQIDENNDIDSIFDEIESYIDFRLN